MVREAKPGDKQAWANLRKKLWPKSNANHHHLEVENYFKEKCKDITKAYVLENSNLIIGFIEINIRNYAEGSQSEKIPYIEGWYVEPEFRRQKNGTKLIKVAELWALENGFTEIASDAELENQISIDAHKATGFKETDRIVCFLKKIRY